MPFGRMHTEIPPGRARHARFFQQALREVVTVGRQPAGIGIQVKRAFRRDRDIEAKRAQRVTILGNEQGVNTATEIVLREAGCTVDRIVAKDTQAHSADDRRLAWTPRSRL